MAAIRFANELIADYKNKADAVQYAKLARESGKNVDGITPFDWTLVVDALENPIRI